MVVKVGDAATAQEVRARWAYAEMRSERFKQNFLFHSMSTHISDCVSAGKCFDQVERDYWAELDGLLDKGRPGEFHDEVKRFANYTCSAWTKSTLGSAYAIRAFNMPDQAQPLPYLDFYKGLPNTGRMVGPMCGIWGVAEESDPRVKAFRSPDRPQIDPAVAIPFNASHLLLDGYLRSIIFMRSSTPGLTFLVWIPA